MAVNRFVSIGQAQVNRFIRDKSGPVHKYLEDLTKETEKLARETAPTHEAKHTPGISSGAYGGPPLRDTISSEVRETNTGLVGIVRAVSPKARPVHEGTPAHEIQSTKTTNRSGKGGGVLVFYAHGEKVFIRAPKGQRAKVYNLGIKTRAAGGGGTHHFYPKGAQPWLVKAMETVLRQKRFHR